ncbi:MAG: hypothetical protein IT581_17800 [Verrucomicrobiales bacterium]|nr:hypothetical protein [Verrucomicrobiales bacterium]
MRASRTPSSLQPAEPDYPVSVPTAVLHTHRRIDEINAAEDRLIANKLRRQPDLVRFAVRNLRRWQRQDRQRRRAAFEEWNLILSRLRPREIADFLASDTPRARRLRQSSPFAGALTEAERKAILKAHAEE